MCDQRKVLRRSAHRIKKCTILCNLVKCFADTIARILNTDLKINEDRAGRYGTRNPKTCQYFEHGSEIKCRLVYMLDVPGRYGTQNPKGIC